MRWFAAFVLVLIAGLFLGRSLQRPVVAEPTVLERLRSVSRLQVLDATVSRKVTLRPDPTVQPTLGRSLWQWARYTVAPPEGVAQVGATAHFSLDLSKLDAAAVEVEGDAVQVLLPEPELAVELSPGSTQVFHSNLDSEQTTQLLAQAQTELNASLAHDPKLLDAAKESSRRAMGALLRNFGFKQIRFERPQKVALRGLSKSPQ
jgi:hypothetical protein